MNRGIDVKSGFEAEVMRSIRINKILTDSGITILPNAGLQEVRRRLQGCPVGELFVIRENGELYGTLTLSDLSEQSKELSVLANEFKFMKDFLKPWEKKVSSIILYLFQKKCQCNILLT